MKHIEDVINHIKEIKNRVVRGEYNSGEPLETDFLSINKMTGIKTNATKYENLREVFAVQEFLIKEVCNLHNSENDSKNEELFQKHLKIEEIEKELQDGKRGYNIYSLLDEGYENFLIGDIHSETVSLKRILEVCDFFQGIIKKRKMRLVFLGDYVDRGKTHLKTVEYMLVLKYLFPEHVFLLKGNHDAGLLIGMDIKLCVGKPADESDEDYFFLYLNNLLKAEDELRLQVLKAYLDFFNSLCNIAIIRSNGVRIFAVHGGIPRPKKKSNHYFDYLSCLRDLTDNRIVDEINRPITDNMLWSDPTEHDSELRESSRRFRFTEEHFDEFRKTIGFDYLIRGHEAELDGYKSFFKGKVITVFSSGSIHNGGTDINNETAYSEILPKILRFSDKGNLELINLI